MDEPFDGKTLFEVTIEASVVVLAKDRKAAENLVTNEWYDISRDIDEPEVSASPCEVTMMGKKRWSVPGEWEGSEPYGDKAGLTCKQIIEAIEAWRKSHITQAELEAAGQAVLPGCK